MKKIIQINPEEKSVVAVHESQITAAKTSRVCLSSIKKCLQNKRKSAGGFLWIHYSKGRDSKEFVEFVCS